MHGILLTESDPNPLSIQLAWRMYGVSFIVGVLTIVGMEIQVCILIYVCTSRIN